MLRCSIEDCTTPGWTPGFWWVNHKQTFTQEIEGRCVCSPQQHRNGSQFRVLGLVESECPKEFGFTGD